MVEFWNSIIEGNDIFIGVVHFVLFLICTIGIIISGFHSIIKKDDEYFESTLKIIMSWFLGYFLSLLLLLLIPLGIIWLVSRIPILLKDIFSKNTLTIKVKFTK